MERTVQRFSIAGVLRLARLVCCKVIYPKHLRLIEMIYGLHHFRAIDFVSNVAHLFPASGIWISQVPDKYCFQGAGHVVLLPPAHVNSSVAHSTTLGPLY